MSEKTASSEATALLTPYAAAKVVNALLAEAGVDKAIPPQMVYNYTTARVRAGKAPFIEVTVVDDKTYISAEALATWATKYVAKQVAQA
jgi:hypothetical protein